MQQQQMPQQQMPQMQPQGGMFGMLRQMQQQQMQQQQMPQMQPHGGMFGMLRQMQQQQMQGGGSAMGSAMQPARPMQPGGAFRSLGFPRIF
jgi:hypothetical protein